MISELAPSDPGYQYAIPKILHYTAATRILRAEEERLIKRAQQIMPDWKIRLWDDQDNLRLVSEVDPGWLENFKNARHGVVRADIARYLILYKFGGFYLDTDYKILRKFDDALLATSCLIPESRTGTSHNGFRLGNAVLASVPNFQFWRDFVSEIFKLDLGEVAEHQIEKITGPEGLTDFFLLHEEYHDQITIPVKHLFHPEIIAGGFGAMTKSDTYGIHLCYGSWRTKNVVKRFKNQLIRYLTSI